MYMIAWLCMLKIYQTRHPDINANAHTAYFAMSLVIFLAVIGVVSLVFAFSTHSLLHCYKKIELWREN